MIDFLSLVATVHTFYYFIFYCFIFYISFKLIGHIYGYNTYFLSPTHKQNNKKNNKFRQRKIRDFNKDQFISSGRWSPVARYFFSTMPIIPHQYTHLYAQPTLCLIACSRHWKIPNTSDMALNNNLSINQKKKRIVTVHCIQIYNIKLGLGIK